jgi:hypothetical protein
MNWLTQPLSLPDGTALNEALRAWLQGGWREWAMQPARTLVACAALLFSLGVSGVWLLWPSDGQDVQTLTLAHQTLQTQVATQRQRLNALQLQASTSADPARALSVVQNAWPTRAQTQSVLMAIHLQAHKQGLQVEWFRPEGVVTSQGLRAQALNLRLRGSFAQVAAWSEAVFQQPALWVPEKWTLSAESRPHSAAQSGTSSTSQVILDALLHLYVRQGEDWTPQALAMLPSLDETAELSMQKNPQRPDSLPRADPFSRPASAAPQRALPLPLDEGVHPLRRWPLRDLTMVGSFSSGGAASALVQTPAGLFRVSVGDELGVEGARVVNLSARQIDLRMPLKPGSARFAEHQAVLSMRPGLKP